MKAKTLYIEKKKQFDRRAVASVLKGIKHHKMTDVKYTINGEDISFLAVETTSNTDTLKRMCSDLVSQEFKAMYSGVIHATAIAGVVRHGNCIGYVDEDNPGMFMQTDIIDNRCMISFPLVENRHIEKKIKFLPLDIPLPTDMKTVDRRIKSMYVLNKKDMSEIDYVEGITSYLAIATMIYPPALIWHRADIPPPIEKLIEALRNANEIPENIVPSYMIMTDNERDYLELYLYVGLFNEDTGDHIIPMGAVIPPSFIVSSGPRSEYDDFVPSGRSIDQLSNIRSIDDLEEMGEFVGNISRGLFGNASGTQIRVTNTEDGRVNIQLKRPKNLIHRERDPE